MTPATLRLMQQLIRLAKGMISACEQWVRDSQTRDPQ